MLVKRNESYNLRSGSLELETSGDLDVKVKLKNWDLIITGFTGFTYINDFNWLEAEKRLEEVLKNKNERVFYISNIYRVRDDLDLNNRNEFDEDEEFVSECVDNNLLDKIECMTLDQIMLQYGGTIKSIDNSYIVLTSADWDNDLVLYIDCRMGYTFAIDIFAPSFFYLVHEDN